jgi:hypothetical protein
MNKKIKINDRTNNINGTSLVGYVKTTYANLVDKLGEPDTDFDKSTAHWSIQASDGTVATIYDYKEYTTPQDEYYWHIGGHNASKACLLTEIVTDTQTVFEYERNWNPYGGGNDQ